MRSATVSFSLSPITSAVWGTATVLTPFASDVNFLCDLDRFVDLDARRLTPCRHWPCMRVTAGTIDGALVPAADWFTFR
jgi:hypothetical protein